MSDNAVSPDRPLGAELAGWQPPPPPNPMIMAGRHCRLEPLEAGHHAHGLYEAFADDRDGRLWTYMGFGPFASFEAFAALIEQISGRSDPMFFAIVDAAGRPLGFAAYMRIDPANGVVEVGSITFAPALQRTAAATEAMALMMRNAFALGYRRYEWKCNALNLPSRRAAERLGFTFEGEFRQHMVVKGRNRDTAWYSILDAEWPRIDSAFAAWLAPENFAADGSQKRSLVECRNQAVS